MPILSDEARIDFLERWVQHSKSRGFKWDSFTFDTNRSVRDQLDEQMRAGLIELRKGGAAQETCEQCSGSKRTPDGLNCTACNAMGESAAETPAELPTQYSTLAGSHPAVCKHCGEPWLDHTHTDETSTCPTANR